jgi:hypothetical protein
MSDSDRRPAYVEFVFRVHEDGTREQFARQVDRLADGTLMPTSGRPGGPQARHALQAALDEGLLGRRRVVIDQRAARPQLATRSSSR